MPILTDELHCHLYGCLTPEDLWSLGRDRWRTMEARLAWYSAEYEKTYGRRPTPSDYWLKDSGLELLRKDFLFTTPGPFSRFQASFNLAIALLPITPDDTVVLSHVLKGQRGSGLSYGEYRCFVPALLTPDQIAAYLATMADKTLELAAESDPTFKPRLIFSLSRIPATGLTQYRLLKDCLRAKPDRAKVVTGIDFCGVEEGHPPSLTAPLIAQIIADNSADRSQALALLYHVGESFTDKTLMSAARWVWQAHQMGAHRLGHALALGLDPEVYRGRQATESVRERRDHLQWLQHSKPWLKERGYEVDSARLAFELNKTAGAGLDDTWTCSYDDEVIADCRCLQQALIADLADKNAIIESCPTSNMLIGQLTPASHPLPRFTKAGLRVVIGADDPGIFATSLAGEEKILRTSFGWSEIMLLQSQELARQSRAESLVGSVGT